MAGRLVGVAALCLYLAYSGYALYRQWGTEAGTRLLLLLVIVLWVSVGRRVRRLTARRLPSVHVARATALRLKALARWSDHF